MIHTHTHSDTTHSVTSSLLDRDALGSKMLGRVEIRCRGISGNGRVSEGEGESE